MEAIAPTCPDRGSFRPIPGHRGGEQRPFSFQPVFDLIVPVPGPTRMRAGKIIRADGDVAAVARAVGLDRQYVYRYLEAGVSPHVADAIAVRLGRHPVAIWPDWFSHAPDEDEVIAFEDQERQRDLQRGCRRAAA
jgi:hypothetical protein